MKNDPRKIFPLGHLSEHSGRNISVIRTIVLDTHFKYANLYSSSTKKG